MRGLIVNADDYGLTPGVSRGILAAHRDGIVTSTTFMVHWPWAAAEAEHLKTAPNLGVGVHLTLTAGRPLLPAAEVSSLVDEAGQFRRGFMHLMLRARPEEARREWSAQVRRFEALTGRKPTHLDSHHHAHAVPALAAALAAVAGAAGIPAARTVGLGAMGAVRSGYGGAAAFLARWFLPRSAAAIRKAGLAAPDYTLVETFDRDRLLRWLYALPGGVTELVCHPGIVDAELAELSSLTAQRAAELAILQDPIVKAVAAGINLLNFAGLGAARGGDGP